MLELSLRRRLLILAICCMSLLIVGMDVTIVNVALPSISSDLHGSISGLQWTIDAYTLVVASLLILGGSTGDRLGRRRIFQLGLVVFTVGSLLCSLAPTLGWLVVFRMMQAVGGSMLNPIAMSIITNVFVEPRERARAIGMWAGASGVSFGLGPLVGGALTETIGWRAIFWVNVPIGIAAIVLTALFVPESRAPHPRRLDPLGQLLVIVILASVTYAIIESPSAGWTSPRTWGMLLVTVVALAALLWYEPRRREPLIDLRFFRSIPFAGATVTAVCAFSAFNGFLFLNTLYLQEVRGLSPLRAGLLTVPMAVTIIVLAPNVGRWVGARGPRGALLGAGFAMTLGALSFVEIADQTSYWWIALGMVVFAIGFSLVNPPITNSAVSGMPRAQAGVAAAFASTSRQVGASLGIAIVGSIVNTGSSARIGTGFSAASHPAWWVIVGCGAAVLLLAVVSTGAWARRSAERTAELFSEQDARLAKEALAR